LAHKFTAKWINGSINGALDALSCNPVADHIGGGTLAEIDYQ